MVLNLKAFTNNYKLQTYAIKRGCRTCDSLF